MVCFICIENPMRAASRLRQGELGQPDSTKSGPSTKSARRLMAPDLVHRSICTDQGGSDRKAAVMAIPHRPSPARSLHKTFFLPLRLNECLHKDKDPLLHTHKRIACRQLDGCFGLLGLSS